MKSTHMYAVQVCMHFQVIHGPQVEKILVKRYFLSFFSIQGIFTFTVIRTISYTWRVYLIVFRVFP